MSDAMTDESIVERVRFALDKYRNALISGVPQKLARYHTLQTICKALDRDPTREANIAIEAGVRAPNPFPPLKDKL